jgi:hypothetical protein
MHKASWVLLASLLACSDDIGSVVCDGTACQTSEFVLQALEVDFVDVATSSPSPLPAFTWSIPCGGACISGERAQLHWAGADRAWNVFRGTALPTVELIDAEGNRSTQQLELPTGANQLVGAYSIGQLDGTLLTHALWSQPASGVLIEEMATFSSSPVQRATMNPLTTPTRQLGAIRGGDGYLLFDDDLAKPGMLVGSTRLVSREGKQIWSKGNLPRVVPFVGGSAVWTTQDYVLAARSATSVGAYFLMWFDPEGTLQRGTSISGSNWRNAQVLDRGQARFIAVAQTDLEAGAAPGGSNEGMIDVVEFDSGQPTKGWRLRRDCLYELEVYGYAVSQEGNIFVSTLVGDPIESHALLCRLPADPGVPRCFRAASGQTFGALVAIGPNSVVAAVNDQIVRIDLP